MLCLAEKCILSANLRIIFLVKILQQKNKRVGLFIFFFMDKKSA